MTSQHGMRLGRWQEALADVRCDAVITDPPYGARTHTMSRALGNPRADGCALDGLGPDYEPLSDAGIAEFVAAWHERCRGWIVALTDSESIPLWQRAYRAVGRYSFAPLPCVIKGMSVRLSGDGPSSWAVYAMAARPSSREWATWGTLDGAYVGAAQPGAGGGRGKPRWLMNALVRDYTRSGDIVVDPFAGWGTTLASCAELGRIGIGAECDPEAYAEAERRLGAPQQIGMAL